MRRGTGIALLWHASPLPTAADGSRRLPYSSWLWESRTELCSQTTGEDHVNGRQQENSHLWARSWHCLSTLNKINRQISVALMLQSSVMIPTYHQLKDHHTQFHHQPLMKWTYYLPILLLQAWNQLSCPQSLDTQNRFTQHPYRKSTRWICWHSMVPVTLTELMKNLPRSAESCLLL